MVQKIIEIVGVSTESFDKAAENAVEEAARSVRNIKWARIEGFEAAVHENKIVQYRATTRIFFDVEH